MKNIIALIPARQGSKRIINKNIKILAGHPLIAYTISVAFKSNIFSRVIVSTDNEKIATIAKYYGADIPFLRPKKYASAVSPDIEWLKFTLAKIGKNNLPEYFAILRPTSPFRTVEMMKKAWDKITSEESADSLRAVELASQHPAKMWKIVNNRLIPVISGQTKEKIEWHSLPFQALPKVYAQNASLEIAKSEIPLKSISISGKNILPFITSNYEGYDINSKKDWIYAEYLIKTRKAKLPQINIIPFKI